MFRKLKKGSLNSTKPYCLQNASSADNETQGNKGNAKNRNLDTFWVVSCVLVVF